MTSDLLKKQKETVDRQEGGQSIQIAIYLEPIIKADTVIESE